MLSRETFLVLRKSVSVLGPATSCSEVKQLGYSPREGNGSWLAQLTGYRGDDCGQRQPEPRVQP